MTAPRINPRWWHHLTGGRPMKKIEWEAGFLDRVTGTMVHYWHDAFGRGWMDYTAWGWGRVRRPKLDIPLPTKLVCPKCEKQHVDRGIWVRAVHRSHLCEHCGWIWRPYEHATVGVE